MIELDLSNAAVDISGFAPALAEADRWLRAAAEGGRCAGWVALPANYDRSEFDRLCSAARRIREDSRALVVIGIGGSYLGARGALELLCSPNYNLKKKPTPNIYFAGCGISGEQIVEIMEMIGEDDFSVNVVSKSGTTTEPAIAFRFFREALERRYGKAGAARRIYATTDRARGALRAMADSEGYESFTIPEDVGGRYSLLTAVGLLPLAVAGVDVAALLAGAAEMMRCCRSASLEDNPAWQYAAARNFLYRSGKKIELLAYSDTAFRFMAEWWKQLFGESEGKEHKGLFPASVEITTDLHAIGQYIQQGERHLFETAVRFAPAGACQRVPMDRDDRDSLNYLAGRDMDEIATLALDGALLAHVEGGVPNIVVHAGEKNAFDLGALAYFFEYACALSGRVLGVDPFDQPGVEAYKRNLFALLGKPGYEALGEALRRKLGR